MANEWQKDEYRISDDRARLDITVIHKFLSTEAYWAIGRSAEKVQRSIDNSLPFGLYRGEEQIGFARVVTDYATFAWLADVFVLDEFRRRGLAKWLIEVIISHPESCRAFVAGCWERKTLKNFIAGMGSPRSPLPVSGWKD